jgi:hypothetical protein
VLLINDRIPLFIGYKVDGSLRRRLADLTGADQRYVSREDSTFLRLCKLGEDEYVGKVIDEPISTDRVDDIRRNVLSILHRLSPEARFPDHLTIFACETAPEGTAPGITR